MLYSRSLLVIYIIYSSVYMSIPGLSKVSMSNLKSRYGSAKHRKAGTGQAAKCKLNVQPFQW